MSVKPVSIGADIRAIGHRIGYRRLMGCNLYYSMSIHCTGRERSDVVQGGKGIEGILGMECTPLAMVCELG